MLRTFPKLDIDHAYATISTTGIRHYSTKLGVLIPVKLKVPESAGIT